jgi:hypothetical protein
VTDSSRDPIDERLRDERPAPSAAFRGELRRRLADRVASLPTGPRTVRLMVAAYAGSGAVLLGIAALGLAGVGPLAS